MASGATAEPPAGAETALDRLIASLRDKAGPVDGQEPPAAVLWPDPQGEWRPLIGALRERLPELLVLGDFDEKAAQGAGDLAAGIDRGSARLA